MKKYIAAALLMLTMQDPIDLVDTITAAAARLRTLLTSTGVTVPQGSNVQAAVDAAPAGTVIRLVAGATYNGQITLGPKGGTLTTTGSLPSGRVGPADVAQLAVVRGLVTTTADAAAWTISGIEVQSTGLTGNLVEFNEGAHDLTLDRCYLHGSATGSQKRGLALNSGKATVTNNYISDIHVVGQDSQAIEAWGGPGPYVIVNNYLEAASENFLTGGADPKTANVVPSDITFTDNELAKPLSWRGQPWNIKNLFELKNSRRVLAERNTMRGVWGAAQTGYAVQLTPRNQDGACTWCTVEDVTFRHNVITQAAAGVNLLGKDNGFPSLVMSRISITDNTFDLDPWLYGGSDKAIQVLSGPVDLTIDRNTITGSNLGSVLYFDGLPKALRMVFTNNIFPASLYGIFGGGSSVGGNPPHAWLDYTSAGTFSGNVQR